MLQLDQISKTYHAGSFTQSALDQVTVTLRDNEFVAILGPSGSGKTTLLNIVGGLDHYDSGDLLIDGVSTNEYKDRDWDAYRNNRIGFVFQSYNLIPHQTVLANVELALTLSGVGKAERTQRAKDALDRVGLSDHIYKKPNQLSGGQMQRVAIARALINDPEILLADEPTGALDSHTSVHVMNLLQQIAQDRLVVLVTHNAELADQYATRIISLKDGQITDDSNPFTPPDEVREAKPARRTSMSFLTAIALSFTNLMTKKGRTLMTSFAGSIGIVGIACILALANGVNAYILSVEQDTLSLYPLTIQSQGFDLTTMLAASSGAGPSSDTSTDTTTSAPDQVHEVKMLTTMLSHVSSNDLASLKTFLDSGQSDIDQYARAVQYSYDVTPQIFADDTTSVRQVNPNTVFDALGVSSSSTASTLTGMSTDVFSSLPDDTDLYQGQYDLVAGHWPQSSNDALLVLTSGGGVSDFTLYAMGLRDPSQLTQMIQQMATGKPISLPTDSLTFTYQQLMGVSFRVVPASAFYQYDPTYNVWTDERANTAWMANAVANGEPLNVVGIAKPDPAATTTMLRPGLYYTSGLVHQLMNQAATSPMVLQQLASPDTNIFSGKTFASEQQNPNLSNFDFSSLIHVDPDALSQFLTASATGAAPSLPPIDFSSIITSAPAVPPADLTTFLSGINVNVSPQDLTQLMTQTLGAYLDQVYGVQLPDGPPTANPPAATPSTPTSAPAAPTSAPTTPTTVPTTPTATPTTTAPASSDPADTAPTGPSTDPAISAVAADEPLSDPTSSDPSATVSLTLPTLPITLPTLPSNLPTSLPSNLPTALPSDFPTSLLPSDFPTALPSNFPTSLPSNFPTSLPTNFPTAVPSTPAQSNQPLPSPDQLAASFSQWFAQPAVQEQFRTQLFQVVDANSLNQQLTAALDSYMRQTMQTMLTSMMSSLQGQLAVAIQATIAQVGQQFAASLQADPSQLQKLFSFNMDPSQLTNIMMSMANNQSNSLDNNLSKMGYADPSTPSSISIYPKDFEAKQHIVDILDAYNARMTASGQDDKVITYTDIVGTLMSSVTDIVNKVSAILVAFVSISLVVSSIMIGVITYISVLERKKEIGILRALGARKRDIANVFNAETLIVGFVAGVMGVLITLLLAAIANPIVYAHYTITDIARLPLTSAVVLIVVSMFLTFIAGLIPSSAASRRDPVEALRSE